MEAWIYKRLKSAGTILVAKLVSGSLAYDDIWFGGRTRNPWNIEEFPTGSYAGSAADTSAAMNKEWAYKLSSEYRKGVKNIIEKEAQWLVNLHRFGVST